MGSDASAFGPVPAAPAAPPATYGPYQPIFNPNVRLDPSQIDDRRPRFSADAANYIFPPGVDLPSMPYTQPFQPPQ